jgi:formylglycine-generating enzyme required for sulfatase activity
MGSIAMSLDEQPVHSVSVTRPFWVGKFEVTMAEYTSVMGGVPSAGTAQFPVAGVTWDAAMNYCAALTVAETAAGRVPAGYQYRLPTEAEWEYCCRAGTTTEWNTGAILTASQANIYYGYPLWTTRPVGSYSPNPWGIYDMHGNVSEWCLDLWDGSPNYPSTHVADPYESNGLQRILRGGSAGSEAISCRSASRQSASPASQGNGIGLRVVLAPAMVP